MGYNGFCLSVRSKYVNVAGFLHCLTLPGSEMVKVSQTLLYKMTCAELNRERNFTFSWLGWYGGLRIQNRVSACICIFNVWPAWTLQPYGHSGHLVRYLDIYDYSGVLPDTFSSPSVKMSKSSCPVIWSVALHRPELSMGDSSGGLTTAHLGQI